MHSSWNFLVDKPPHRDKVSSIEGENIISIALFYWRQKINTNLLQLLQFTCFKENKNIEVENSRS